MKALFGLLLIAVVAVAGACVGAQGFLAAANSEALLYAGTVPADHTDTDLNGNEFYIAGWEYGFGDCQSTCAEYIESSEWGQIEGQSQFQTDMARRSPNRKRRAGTSADETGLDDDEVLEVVAVPNSESWLYWQGYSDGYTYCSYGCQQFFPEDQMIEFERRDQNQVNAIQQ